MTGCGVAENLSVSMMGVLSSSTDGAARATSRAFGERKKEEFGEVMLGARAVKAPMAKSSAMHEDETELRGAAVARYQSMVGTLNYFAMATRYDVSFAAARLSQRPPAPHSPSRPPPLGSRSASLPLSDGSLALRHSKRY